MRIEATIDGLTKAKETKVPGLRQFDRDTGIGIFEWNGAEQPPHDYATAMDRARGDLAAAGAELRSVRLLG